MMICKRSPIFLLALLAVGCGRIWGTVTWGGGGLTSTFAYSCSTQVFLVGVSNTANSPGISGGYTYSISPALPAGLSMDPQTGIISGSPTVVTAMTPYTVTVSWSGGNTTTTVNIRTAQGYLVNDLSDLAYAGPGCVSTGSTCTLRAAIGAINATTNPNVILMPSGKTTLTLGTALAPTQPMDIYGNCSQNTVVDGNSATQIFNVINSGNISFNNLTIQNGLASSANGVGIGISNTGVGTFTASINNSTIQNNTLTAGSGFSQVGAGVTVYGVAAGNSIVLNINNSMFYNNQQLSAISDAGALSIGYGGHVWGQANITNTSFISNSDSGGGGSGGIVYSGSGGLNVSDSLFYNNSLTGAGGGVAVVGGNGMNFTNVTFDSNNTATVADALIYDGTANFTNCTFANNLTTSKILRNITAGNIVNTIFYNNGSICNGSTLTSLGGNLSDQLAADCTLNQPTDIVSTNAQLGNLQNNGGSTQTMALNTGSPAIGNAVLGSCPATDQRGYSRPHSNNTCDIGAFETEP